MADVAEVRHYFNDLELKVALFDKALGTFDSESPVGLTSELSHQAERQIPVAVPVPKARPDEQTKVRNKLSLRFSFTYPTLEGQSKLKRDVGDILTFAAAGSKLNRWPFFLERKNMSTTLEPETETGLANVGNAVSRVRQNFVACRVKFKWFGTSKSLTNIQKNQAAESFGADGKAISAAKRLIDTRHESYKSLTSIKNQINKFWRDSSLPYPEPGIRLIRNDAVGKFDSTLISFKDELENGVWVLDGHFVELKEAARQRLGSLFDTTDYPSSLTDEFEVDWDFPSVEAPDYLRRLSPEIYQQECERVQSQFASAVSLAEQMFQDQLAELVEHLVERLSTDESGKQKTFRDSTLGNLEAFFARFQQLNIGSNEELEKLVEQAQGIVRGVDPQRLRSNDSLRQHIATQMSVVQSSLDGLVVDRPRRNIIRSNRQKNTEA